MRGGTGMRAAMAAEWTKLRTVRSTWWCLGTALVLQVVYAALVGWDASSDLEHDGTSGSIALGDAGTLSLQFAQYALIAWALLAVTSEYSTGAITTSLRCVPRRGVWLTAKATVVALVAAATTLVLMVAAALAAWATAGSAAEVGDLVGDIPVTIAYGALLAVFTLGLGAAVRSAVGGLTLVIVLAVVVPTVVGRIRLDWLTHVNDYLPGSAGVAVLYGRVADPGDGVHQPYGTWIGLLVLTAWAAAAIGAGWTVLRHRDA